MFYNIIVNKFKYGIIKLQRRLFMHVNGRSYSNGVEFSATKYKVNFETYSDVTKFFLRKNEVKEMKRLDFLNGFPFLRGLRRLLEAKLLFLLMILDVIVNIAAVNSVEEESLFGKLIWVFLLGVACILAWDFVIIIKNLKSVWQYHGAEHKVILTNLKNEPLTVENCRKTPRIADDCGTLCW